jgi:hypothetical protein
MSGTKILFILLIFKERIKGNDLILSGSRNGASKKGELDEKCLSVYSSITTANSASSMTTFQNL